jgi:hypothetical protein
MFTLQTWVINIYILVSKSNHGFDPAGAMSGNAVVQLLHALHEAMPEYIFKPRARSTLACTALHRLQKHDHNMCCLRQALHQTHAPTTLSVNMHCSLRSVCVGGGGVALCMCNCMQLNAYFIVAWLVMALLGLKRGVAP